MGDNSAIQWTDATWNPIRGCTKVSAGCDHCYAMRQARRMDHAGGAYEGLTRIISGRPQWNGKVRMVPDLLDQPLRWQKRRMIFVNSMSDLFHESVPDEFIGKVFSVMEQASHHIFQVLTKRPERMYAVLSNLYHDRSAPANVWLGVSVEDQETAQARIPWLLDSPAHVRWVSAEPLLGPIIGVTAMAKLDWLVIGGESGPGARHCQPRWLADLVDWCRAIRTPVFVKQMGADCGLKLKHKKGGDMSEWPERLQVREWPAAANG